MIEILHNFYSCIIHFSLQIEKLNNINSALVIAQNWLLPQKYLNLNEKNLKFNFKLIEISKLETIIFKIKFYMF